MREVEIEELRKSIHYSYRRRLSHLKGLQTKFINTPTDALKVEIFRGEGFLLGLKKGLEIIEHHANGNELPFDEVQLSL